MLVKFLQLGSITPTNEGFRKEVVLEGTSALGLNLMLLTSLRRIDCRATLHAAGTTWGITECIFR